VSCCAGITGLPTQPPSPGHDTLEQVLNDEIAGELRPLRQTEPKPVRAIAK
jgi:hypothetical protein